MSTIPQRLFHTFALGITSFVSAAAVSAATPDVLSALSHRQVTLGGEMGRRIKMTENNAMLNIDVNHVFLNAYRLKNTIVCQRDRNVGTFLSAVVKMAAHTGDARTIALKSHLVTELLKAQTPDGYLGLFAPGYRYWGPATGGKAFWWVDFQLLGNILTALCDDYTLFNNADSLQAARKQADSIVAVWGSRPHNWLGESEDVFFHTVIQNLDFALDQMTRLTGDAKYRNLAMNQLGVMGWNYPIDLGGVPPKWNGFRGHVYGYMARCLAQLELYRSVRDPSLLISTQRALDFMLNQDGMVIDGGSGLGEIWSDKQLGTGGHFSDKDHDCACEVAATTYIVRTLDSKIRLEGVNGRYADVIERTIYNGIFGAQEPITGSRLRGMFFYDGPRAYADVEWTAESSYGNYCKILADLPTLTYYTNPSKTGLTVNLYGPSTAQAPLNGVSVAIRQETDYPNSGNVRIVVNPARAIEFPLSVRIPTWCPQAAISINGQAMTGSISSGAYHTIQRKWKAGDVVDLKMPMAWRFVRGRQSQAGRFALLRGPLIFCYSPSRQTTPVDMNRATVDPATIQGPFADHAIRPGGLACTARAKLDGIEYQIFLSEFTDPNGEVTHYLMNDAGNPAFVPDELLRGAPL
jgi:DUF1680 family protein